MKKVIGALIMTAVIGALILYCFRNFNTPAAKSLEKVSLMVPSLAQIEWAPFYTAINKGYYQDEGLELSLIYNTKGNSTAFGLLESNKTQFVYSCTETFIKARYKGVNAVAVSVFEPKNMLYIVSDSKYHITKPADLVGKKIGMASATGSNVTFLKLLLKKQGQSINDIEQVPLGTALIPGFLENKIDAAVVVFINKLQIDNYDHKLNVISGEDYNWKSKTHLITTRDYLKTHGDTVRKFLKATEKGIAYAVAHPEEAFSIYNTFNPDDKANSARNLETWRKMISAYGYNNRKSGVDNLMDWQDTQDVLLLTGEISKKSDLKTFFTNDYLPEN